MVRRGALLRASLSLLLSACTGTAWWPIADLSTNSPSATAEPSPSAVPVAITELAAGARDTSPTVSGGDLNTLVRGNTAFAIDLYQRLAQGSDGNLALGPYSISSAFALLNAGAAGQTQAQITSALHFGLPVSRLDRAFDALSIALESTQRPALTLATTNRIFGQEGYPFRDSYVRELTENFGAPIAMADFRDHAELDRELINAWAAGKTNGRISELLPKGSIDAATRFVLVNAQYLNAKWLDQFPEDATSQLPFHGAGGMTSVPTMATIATVPVHIGSAYDALELPYVGGQLAMLVVMPSDMRAFEHALSPAVLSNIVGSLREQQLWVQLPSFSTRTRLFLKDALVSMGMTDVFDPGRADLSSMLDIGALATMTPPEIPAIGDAVHQAWIRVTESGTEAAASTALIGTLGGGPSLTLSVDRPFLWFIRDRATGTILFMGRMEDPSPGS
jgi:serpin B